MTEKSYPLSWNIDAGDLRHFLRDNNGEKLLAHLDKVQPTCILIMDGLGLARQIKDKFPKMVVIHRDFSGHQGAEWNNRTPEEFVEKWKREGHHDIVRYLTNEPQINPNNILEYAFHEAKIMELARAAGFTVVALNTGIGRYEKLSVQNGDFDALLIAAMAGYHYLGCHEYYTVSLPASLMHTDYLLQANQLQPEKWRTEPIHAGYYDYWYLFRHIWFVKRLFDLGYSEAAIQNKFILTEFGYDDISNEDNKNIIATLKQKFGIELYNNDMKGVSTYRKLHDAYFPDMIFHERIVKEFEWWIDIKPNWILGACIFAFNADWDIPAGHDYSSNAMRDILPMLEDSAENYRQGTPPPLPDPTPIPIFEMKRAHIHSTWAGGSNIRAGFTTQSKVIGKLSDISQTGSASLNSVENDGFQWHKVIMGDVVGYIAKTEHIVIAYIDDTPAPDDSLKISREFAEAQAQYHALQSELWLKLATGNNDE